jgi:CMP-N,N'-diacetyllegionaminic acid synthase
VTDSPIVALIPARGGSQRVKRKNVKLLAGKPLLAYTIVAARASGVFGDIFVSTEDREIEKVALAYGADVVIRPAEYAADSSPDIDWLRHALVNCHIGDDFESFALLRPTSPFRSAATILRAWEQWVLQGDRFDSMRAVERVSQHPGKSWLVVDGELAPFHTFGLDNPPSHSRPTQSLPPVWIQTASLEIAHVRTVTELHSLSGNRILPFYDSWPESHDVNSEADFLMAEVMVDQGLAKLPEVEG